MTGTIEVVGWEKHQHYKKDKPAWIKVYRDLLGNYEFMYELDDAGRWLVVGLWLLAAETGNQIPHNLNYLNGRLRPSEPLTDAMLITLQSLGFVALGGSSRGSLAKVYSKTETETEKETENISPLPPLRAEGDVEKWSDLIREHLHLGSDTVRLEDGTELGLGVSIKKIRKLMAQGYSPQQVRMAILGARAIDGLPADQPITLGYVARPGHWEQAVSAGYKTLEPPENVA